MAEFMHLIQLYSFMQRIQLTRKINGLLYYIRKIPLIGKRIPATIFQYYDIKHGLFILGAIVSILFKLLLKFIWIAVGVGIMILIKSITNFSGLNGPMVAGLILWFGAVPLLSRAIEGFMQSFYQSELDFINYFQIAPRDVLCMKTFVEPLRESLFYLPVFVVSAFILGNFCIVPVGLLGYLGFAAFFFYQARLIRRLAKWPRFVLSGSVYGSIIAALGLILWQNYFSIMYQVLFSFWGCLGLLLFVVGASLLLIHDDQESYSRVLMRTTGLFSESKKTKRETNAYFGEGLRIQKELQFVEGEKSQLKGNHYLNALLFTRYRAALNKSLKWRLLWIFVGGVGLTILMYFLPKSADNEKIFINQLPVLFFLMYLLGFGKKIVQILFINCDAALLFYPFYREPKTILQGFYYRFWKTFYYNGILSVSILAMFLLVNIVNGFFLGGLFFGLLVFLLFSLSFLLSFHELFVYYILQPFSSDLAVVNPAYKIISGVFYWVAYMSLQIKSSGLIYCLLVSGVSLIYVAIGVIVIWKKAPQTFKFKG